MMIFVIAMTGLSVDVGSAFSRERQLQSTSNAAALAGMNAVLTRQTNSQVWENIKRTLAGNRVNTSGVDYTYRADYILKDGSKVFLAQWNSYTEVPPAAGSMPPANIIRVQITAKQKVPTSFVRIVGRNDFTVHVDGNACLSRYGLGILPLSVPLNLQQNYIVGGKLVPYHRIYDAKDAQVTSSDPAWHDWAQMQGKSIYLPIAAKDDLDGHRLAWLGWKGDTGLSSLKAGMTYPGTLQEGFSEGTPADPRLTNTLPQNQLTLGDWVTGITGPQSALQGQLNQLKSSQQLIGLPLYDSAGIANGKSTFHIVKVGLFRIKDANMTGSTNFVKVEYVGDKPNAPTECDGEPNQVPGTTEKKLYAISGVTTVDRVYGIPTVDSNTTFDFLLVMDTSGSMGRDWYDGSGPARLGDARNVIKSFVRNYDVPADIDSRMAFITFSGSGTKTLGNLARIEVPWTTSGCPRDSVITPTLCTDDKKWPLIQSKAAAMNANGLTPGPAALEQVEKLLKDKRTPPSGKTYRQVVVFATDGVFNVCGSTVQTTPAVPLNSCPFGDVVPKDKGITDPMYYDNPDYSSMPGRPLWQAKVLANRIKAAGTEIFIIALTPRCTPAPGKSCFITKGLPDLASGSDHYFEADAANILTDVYSHIEHTVVQTDCKPGEALNDVAPGAVVRLTQPSDPNFKVPAVTADSNGSWTFKNIPAGKYVVTVDPLTLSSKEDGKSRTYSYVINLLNPNEEKQASVDIDSRFSNGSIVPAAVKLTLPRGENGATSNGCQVP